MAAGLCCSVLAGCANINAASTSSATGVNAGLASDPPQVRGAVPMTATRPVALALCKRGWLMRPFCPVRLPVAAGKLGAHGGGAFAGCSGGTSLNAVPVTSKDCRLSEWQLQLLASPRIGPHALKARLRPPWFVHVLLYASRVGNPLPFALPRGPARPVRNALLDPKRTQPISLGSVRWSGRYGQLVLAPAYPRGGEAGDHLMFLFDARSMSYAITLHAWAPLTQTVATLKSIVASAP